MENLTLSPKKILLIEDEPVVILVHSMMLQRLGYAFDKAETGAQALTLSEQPYDLILLDIGLPDISGFDVASSIRARHDGTENTRIVAITGFRLDEVREQCLALDIKQATNKPITMDGLQKLMTDPSSYLL